MKITIMLMFCIFSFSWGDNNESVKVQRFPPPPYPGYCIGGGLPGHLSYETITIDGMYISVFNYPASIDSANKLFRKLDIDSLYQRSRKVDSLDLDTIIEGETIQVTIITDQEDYRSLAQEHCETLWYISSGRWGFIYPLYTGPWDTTSAIPFPFKQGNRKVLPLDGADPNRYNALGRKLEPPHLFFPGR